MMRLVTQFDDARTRATVATPTCCCCCCCCLASVLSTTGVTVLNVGELAASAQMPKPHRWLYSIAALAALPAATFAAGASSAAIGNEEQGFGLGVAVFVVVWTAALVLLYRQVGLRRCARPVGVTVLLGAMLFFVEFWVAALFLLEAEGTFVLYLVIAFVLPFGLVPLLRRLSGP